MGTAVAAGLTLSEALDLTEPVLDAILIQIGIANGGEWDGDREEFKQPIKPGQRK